MRMASDETVATTSPVGTVRVSASPVSAALWPMSWAERKALVIQFMTAYLCRMAPAAALITMRPTRAPAQRTRALESPPTMPSSMARLIAAGKSAWLTIHTMPNTMATARVRHWPRPTHDRYAAGEVRTGVPGSAGGRMVTRSTVRPGADTLIRFSAAPDMLASVGTQVGLRSRRARSPAATRRPRTCPES